jgi:hypothetical protein
MWAAKELRIDDILPFFENYKNGQDDKPEADEIIPLERLTQIKYGKN